MLADFFACGSFREKKKSPSTRGVRSTKKNSAHPRPTATAKATH
jgi:hypothetical protein